MSSITWWNRLEPRPRSGDPARALEAQVRDPAWFLARQWQFGEFIAEDTGSPAFVQLTTRTAPFVGVRLSGGTPRPLPPGKPLEQIVESEAFSPDLMLRVELGQTLDSLLIQEGLSQASRDLIRRAYEFSADVSNRVQEPEAERFGRVCNARAIDGYRFYEALTLSSPDDPSPIPDLAGGERAKAHRASITFKSWVEEVYGGLGQSDPPSWRPDRLEYGAEVFATRPTGEVTALSAQADREGGFDWYAFDEVQGVETSLPAGVVKRDSKSVLPVHVRFRGMANHRFWDFEWGRVNFSGVEADTRDLARLLVMDFMLVHSNDWFILPLEQPAGTCRIDSLVVHDVFGGLTQVDRADAKPGPVGKRWTMFSTTAEDRESGLADYFVLPPSAAAVTRHGQPLETVHLLRDPVANLAWAVEHATEGPLGVAWRGHEREVLTEPAAQTSASGDGSPLNYQIQTSVPRHWIPLLPVSLDALEGTIALVLGSMIRAGSGGEPQTSAPLGRILNPSTLGGSPYRIPDEEVPRIGTRVSRVTCVSRWIDGSNHIWIARRKSAGAGEGSSGLRFDTAQVREADV